LRKAHETRDSLAVPVRMQVVSIHFVAKFTLKMCVAAGNRHKLLKTYFGGSMSFKVIDADTNKKLVTIAC